MPSASAPARRQTRLPGRYGTHRSLVSVLLTPPATADGEDEMSKTTIA